MQTILLFFFKCAIEMNKSPIKFNIKNKLILKNNFIATNKTALAVYNPKNDVGLTWT